jgi:hypothetical protein
MSDKNDDDGSDNNEFVRPKAVTSAVSKPILARATLSRIFN